MRTLPGSLELHQIFRIGSLVAYTYFLAGTASVVLEQIIPEKKFVSTYIPQSEQPQTKTLAEFDATISRNLFSSQGLIGGENSLAPGSEGIAVKTSLALNLVGTVVLKDPKKSIAALEEKETHRLIPVRVSENIDGKFTIRTIDHLRVTFLNHGTGQLEYVEIPEDKLLSITSGSKPINSSSPSGATSIEQQGNNFNIARSEIDKSLKDFNSIIKQAYAVPNFENGAPNGFKILSVEPNSIYSKLGIKVGDVVMAVNGAPMTDAGKALQLVNELRSGSSHMEITLKSGDGQVRTQSYDIR